MVKLDHMRLPVSNPQVTRDWYVRNFGFEIEFENEHVVALKDDADFTIFLYPAHGDLAGAKCVVSLQVDGEAKHRELAALGVKFHKPPGSISGATARLYDPDGYLLNLWDEVSMREKGGG